MFINLILSLANSFLLEMVIAKDPSYLSLQYFMYSSHSSLSLPARASEQGNVIRLVSVYIYVIKKKL